MYSILSLLTLTVNFSFFLLNTLYYFCHLFPPYLISLSLSLTVYYSLFTPIIFFSFFLSHFPLVLYHHSSPFFSLPLHTLFFSFIFKTFFFHFKKKFFTSLFYLIIFNPLLLYLLTFSRFQTRARNKLALCQIKLTKPS